MSILYCDKVNKRERWTGKSDGFWLVNLGSHICAEVSDEVHAVGHFYMPHASTATNY